MKLNLTTSNLRTFLAMSTVETSPDCTYGDQTYRNAEAEFDRWLNEVKAQAWDEGYVAGADPHCGSQALNPYRKGN